MANAHDLYHLLGVRRNASSAEIRAAYVALLKRHHPDLADSPGDGRRSNYVAALNLAFATLRDPRKRAEYDSQLRLREPPPRTARTRSADSRQIVRTPPARVQFGSSAARFALAFGATILALLVGGQIVRGGPLGDAFGLSTAFGGFADRPEHRRPMSVRIPEAERARLVRAASTMSIEEAIAASRRCFGEAVDQRHPAGVLGCIIFDDAVLMLAARDEHRNALPAYFRVDLTRNRHVEAVAGWTSNPGQLLETLSSLTLRSLLGEIRSVTARDAAATPVIALAADEETPRVDSPQNPELGQTKLVTSQLTQSKLDLATQGEVP